MVTAVLLAGGVGSRLWPLSRELYPKQLLSIYGDESLLQATLRRVVRAGVQSCIIVGSEQHRFYLREQVEELRLSNDVNVKILLEPAARNTAPAIALAAHYLTPDEVMCVFPADHYMEERQFNGQLQRAVDLAQQGYLTTFGVRPSSAETGYGYVELGDELAPGVHRVQSFVEKPSATLARTYVESGRYWWNSGMFCFQAGRYLAELAVHRPMIANAVADAAATAYADLGFIKYRDDLFSASPAESIDYAVMEQTTHAVVVELTDVWSDIGSWSALHALKEQDEQGNVLSGDVVALATRNTLVHGSSRLVAALGLEEMIVVETPDAVLVAKRDQDQAIKQVVSELTARGRDEHHDCKVIRRPWGHYTVLEKTEAYEVRRVVVKAGQKIGPHDYEDYQHQWTVLSGELSLQIADKRSRLEVGTSGFATAGQQQALFSVGDVDLVLIEVKHRVTVTA